MPRTLLLRTLLVPALAVLLASCSVFDKPETVPAYVQVESFTLADTTGAIPIYDFEINEVWAFLDGKYVGTFGLPTRKPGIPVPVVEGQSNRLKLYPGIRADRMEQARVQYPFYDPDSVDGLQPTQTYTLNGNGVARARLSRNLRQPSVLQDDFENGTLFTADLRGTAIERLRHRDQTDVTPPPGGGEFFVQRRFAGLDTTGEWLDILSKEPLTIPDPGRLPYLEFQYRSNITMLAGVKGGRADGTKQRDILQLVLSASPTWKKVYVYLYDEVFAVGHADEDFDQFHVIFKGALAKKSGDFIAVDNVRLSEYKP